MADTDSTTTSSNTFHTALPRYSSRPIVATIDNCAVRTQGLVRELMHNVSVHYHDKQHHCRGYVRRLAEAESIEDIFNVSKNASTGWTSFCDEGPNQDILNLLIRALIDEDESTQTYEVII